MGSWRNIHINYPNCGHLRRSRAPFSHPLIRILYHCWKNHLISLFFASLFLFICCTKYIRKQMMKKKQKVNHREFKVNYTLICVIQYSKLWIMMMNSCNDADHVHTMNSKETSIAVNFYYFLCWSTNVQHWPCCYFL